MHLSKLSLKKQMLTIVFVSSLSKTFWAWSGGNLSIEVITLAIVCEEQKGYKLTLKHVIFCLLIVSAILIETLKVRMNKTESWVMYH